MLIKCGCLPIDQRLDNGHSFLFIVVLKKTAYWQPLNSLYLSDFQKVSWVASINKLLYTFFP